MLKFWGMFLLPCFSSMAMATIALASRRDWDANQLPCLASRDVAPLGADVVLCKVPLLVGMLDIRG